MTTLRELGEMLIAVDDGRFLQARDLRSCPSNYVTIMTIKTEHLTFNLTDYEYRLKPVPKITYYRAYRKNGLPDLLNKSDPWGLVADWLPDMCKAYPHDEFKHIHDFQIEEEE